MTIKRERSAGRDAPPQGVAKVLRDPDGLLRARRMQLELDVHRVELEMQNDELARTRDEAADALQRFTELFDFAPVGYLVVEPNTAIVDANVWAANMLGVPRAKLLGRTLVSFLGADDRCTLYESLAQVLTADDDEPARSVQDVALGGDAGTAMAVRLITARVAAPEPQAMIAMVDQSARERAERALREEIGRRDEFRSALSHELRNPLSPILTALALLERVGSEPPKGREALKVLRRQVDHLSSLVNDLVDTTRIARGKVRLACEPIDLGGLVQASIDDYREAFDAQGVAVSFRVRPEPVWVHADPGRVLQITGNLLCNALKFTARGGKVDVGLSADGGEAVLTVRDDGVGIASEVMSRLFEPFVQAPQEIDRARGGLGLGLAMVRGLIELHGGTVRVASNGLGQGSEFTVRLPCVRAPRSQPRLAVASRERVSRRVLVVDDCRDSADLLREFLELEQHEVRAAYDGPTALAIAREFRPEFAFCDIGLPGMAGYEIARAMRAESALDGTVLVALSGYAQPEDRARSFEAGFDTHLAKPAPLDAVLKLLTDPTTLRPSGNSGA